jgi:hypothetical protein
MQFMTMYADLAFLAVTLCVVLLINVKGFSFPPYAGKIMLALDTTAARLSSYDGEIGLDYIFTDFIPQLREAGFSEEVIRGYTTVNCWNAFAASTK